MMKKVLVTGASGFIGNYVIEELLKSDFSVIATSANPGNVKDKPWLKQVNYIPFNLHDYSSNTNYYSFFNEPDILIHLAWEGLPNYKALFHFEENLPRHYAFLKNMISNGLKDLSVTGTCLEYGMVEGRLDENMKTDPRNSYAIAKDSLQKFLSQLGSVTPFSFKWIRLFYMYGKGQNPNSILSQLDKAIAEGKETFNMSGGEQVRDYLPVETVARYIVQIATQQNVSGIINCCSGKPIRLKDFVENYLKQKNSSIKLNLGFYPYLDYEPMAFWGDDSKWKSIVVAEGNFPRREV
jgi:dTDP-6-deoxy-L-talose 4-dehydrogenase (NAD+)